MNVLHETELSPRRQRSRERRTERIVATAGRLLAEEGFDALTMGRLAEELGVSVGSLYRYFRSKDALVAEVVSRGVDVVEGYLRAVQGETPAARVTAVLAALETFARAQPEYVLLFHQARGLVKLGHSGTARLREVLERYLRLVEAALAPPGDEAARMDRAAVVAGAAAGYRSFRLAVGQTPDPGTLARALVEGLGGG